MSREIPDIVYPGLPYADGASGGDAPPCRYLAVDSETRPAFLQTSLVFDARKKAFTAKNGIYESLRNEQAIPCSLNPDSLVFEAAVLDRKSVV